jgi:lysophospholipase L1-like esterase
MKPILRWLVLPLLLTVLTTSFSVAQDGEVSAKVPLSKAPLSKAPLSKLELVDGDSIVFLGDSITHQCLYTQYIEDFFYTRFPKMRLKFHNSGVGGARAWDALQRFDDDVAAYKPKYVTVLLGMNDGTYQPFHQETFDAYHRDMTELIGKLVETGAQPILMTPTMYDSRAARLNVRPGRVNPPERLELYNSVLAYYGTWLREVASEGGYGFVDMWGPLNNLTLAGRKTDPEFTLIRDAVHPDAPGQVVMAVAVITDMGLQKPLSSIRVSLHGNGEPVSSVSGGALSEVKRLDDGVEFSWLADGLPWVMPEEAALGAKITKLGHRNSREALEIQGLAPGRYEVTIDGQSIGIWGADALARHIELQENEKTPQYQQAAVVAKLNSERNAGPVKNLRNEWRAFQQYARLKRDAQSDDDRKRLAQLGTQIEGLQARVAAHAAEASKLEDSIFEMNQPQTRRYVIRKVAAR